MKQQNQQKWYRFRKCRVRNLALLETVLFLIIGQPAAWAADSWTSQDLLALGRVEYFMQRSQWEDAAAELGRMSKEMQETAPVRHYAGTIQEKLHAPAHPPVPPPTPLPSATKGHPYRVEAQSRVTHRHIDASENSDQIADERGWQYNNQFIAQTDAKGYRHTVRGSVDGYQNGVNDLRARQFSYQVEREGVRVTTGDVRNYLTHHKVVDPSNPLASYTGYTLRSTQLRGLDAKFDTERNELHMMAGVAPYFLSPSDEYIYPRQIYGLRDSYKFTSWYRAGIGASYVRDNIERIEHVDSSIQPRETGIISFEQDLTIIPGHWEINTENAYSTTDDNLTPNRFGDNTKLKDTAHSVFSEWRWPVMRVLGSYERIGPDFRAPSDIATIGAVNSKNVSADRENITLRAYPRRVGPLFGSLLYSRTQNNLSDDSTVERTREHWITAQSGLDLPDPWPQPGVRATFIRTTSIPGNNNFSPDGRWVYDLNGDLYKRAFDIDWTGEYQYLQSANDHDTGFDDTYRRTWGLRMGRQLWPGAYASTRGAWTRAQDLFNNSTLRRHTEREFNVTLSTRLWDKASLTGGYTYQDLGAPIVVDTASTEPHGAIIHTISSSFAWPFSKRFRNGNLLSLTPSIFAHISDASDELENHPAVGMRLTTRYWVRDKYRLEFMLEGRQDDDMDFGQVRTEEWRSWLYLTTKFGPGIDDEAPLR